MQNLANLMRAFHVYVYSNIFILSIDEIGHHVIHVFQNTTVVIITFYQ